MRMGLRASRKRLAHTLCQTRYSYMADQVPTHDVTNAICFSLHRYLPPSRPGRVSFLLEPTGSKCHHTANNTKIHNDTRDRQDIGPHSCCYCDAEWCVLHWLLHAQLPGRVPACPGTAPGPKHRSRLSSVHFDFVQHTNRQQQAMQSCNPLIRAAGQPTRAHPGCCRHRWQPALRAWPLLWRG